MQKKRTPSSLVVSALHARTHFGSILGGLERQRGSVVIEKRGTPRAILLSLQNYVRLAAPEPEILRIIGEESELRGTDRLSAKQLDEIIRKTRAQKAKR